MSSEALTWAKQQTAGSTGRKALLLLLADIAGEHGVLWAGVDYLAPILECNRTTVMANLKQLEDAGLIARVERRKPNGARAGTVTVLAPLGDDRGAMQPFEAHGIYGEMLAENLGRDFPRGKSPRGENVEPKSGFTTRTNIEPESSANADDVESARTRTRGRKPETDPDAIRLCGLLASLISEHDPAWAKPTGQTREAWIRDMRLLIRKDRGGDVATVEQVIRWVQADRFWHSNVMCPGKLRDKFSQLLMRMNTEQLPAPAPLKSSVGRRVTAKEERTAELLAMAGRTHDQPQPQIEEGGPHGHNHPHRPGGSVTRPLQLAG